MPARGPELRDHLRVLGFGALMRGASLACTSGLGLVTIAVLVRALGLRGYGEAALALKFAGALGSVAEFGLGTAVNRHASLTDDDSLGWPRTAGAMSIWGGGAAGLVMLAIAVAGGGALGHCLAAASPLALLMPFQRVVVGTLGARRRIAIVEGSFVLKSLLNFSVVIALAGTHTLTAPRAVLAQTGAWTVAVVALTPTWWRASSSGHVASRRAVLRYSFPLALSVLSWAVIQHADVLLLGLAHGAHAVGRYAPVLQAAGMSDVLVGAIAAYFLPVITPTLIKRDRTDAARLYQTSAGWAVLISAPLLAALLVAPEPLLRLTLGTGFDHMQAVTRVLATGFAVNAITGFNSRSLVAIGATRAIAVRSCVAIVLDLALNAVLIPPFGALGAAIATASVMICLNLANSVLLWRMTGISPLVPRHLALCGTVLLTVGTVASVVVATGRADRLSAPLAAGLAAAVAAGAHIAYTSRTRTT